jgi:hypothetical protein
MIDELQALHDRIRSTPWPFVDIQAEQKLLDTMRDKLPAFLRLARAAKDIAGNVPLDIDSRIRWLEVQVGREEWAELLAALGELEREHG